MATTGIDKHESVRSRFQVQIEKWYFDDALPPAPDVLKPLVDCCDTLPEKYCDLLGLAVGSTYRDAVDKFAPGDMYVLDLHGYPVRQAVEIAGDTVKAAYEAGFEYIKLIHGAPDVEHRMTAQVLGRGGIKWELRGFLARGDWSRYVYPRRSAKHGIGDGAMALALRQKAANTNFGMKSKGIKR